jgi:hypothetical protein
LLVVKKLLDKNGIKILSSGKRFYGPAEPLFVALSNYLSSC